MLTTAAIRNAKPTSRDDAPSFETAQIPTNTQPAEKEAEPTNETASTGRSVRSTSWPQTRRKSQAKSLTAPSKQDRPLRPRHSPDDPRGARPAAALGGA